MAFFFFSSRRRHTRSLCDWSSDVCSSDLTIALRVGQRLVNELLALLQERQHRAPGELPEQDRKSTRLNSSHTVISYAVFCLKKKKKNKAHQTDTQKNRQDQRTTRVMHKHA